MALDPAVIAYLTEPALLAQAKAADQLGHDNLVTDCLKEQGTINARKAMQDIERDKANQAIATMAAQASLATGGEADDQCFREMFVALASKYMTTSTATAIETVAADAKNDATRLQAAIEAAWPVYLAGIAKVRA